MTKKDYIIIANAIKLSITEVNDNREVVKTVVNLALLLHYFCIFAEEDNKHFDSKRFKQFILK